MGSNDFQQYQLLIKEAQVGLSLVPEDSARVKAMFNLFLGVGYEYLKDYPHSLDRYRNCVRYASKIQKLSYQITALSRMEIIYNLQNNVSARREVMNEMIELSKNTDDLSTKEMIEDMLSGYYRDINDYEKAIEYKIKSYQTYKKLIKTDTLVTPELGRRNLGFKLSNIGNLFNELGQSEKALEYLYQAKEIIGNEVFEGNEETLYTYFIQSFLNLDQLDSARYYYRESYKKMANRDTVYGALSYMNYFFGQYFLNKKEIDSASFYAQRSYGLALNSDNEDNSILANHLLGKVYARQKKYTKAIELLSSVLENDFEFDQQILADIHQSLAECYEKTGLMDSAYAHYKAFVSINESIMEAKANENFAMAEAKFQNREKQLTIIQNNLKLANAHKQRLLLMAGLALSLMMIGLLYIIYRNKKKNAELLNENNVKLSQLNDELQLANETKATLFSIMGHDLRSPVNQVHQFLKILQLNSNALSSEQKEKLQSDIQQSTLSLLDTMENLLLWSKSQMKDFKPHPEKFMLDEMIQETLGLMRLNLESKNLNVISNYSKEIQLLTDKNYLDAIFRNLFLNAIQATTPHSSIIIQ